MKEIQKRIFEIFTSAKRCLQAVVAVLFVLFSSVIIHLSDEKHDAWPNLNKIGTKNKS